VAADFDPSVEGLAASIPQMRRGRRSTKLRRVDQRTSDLVDGETVGGGEEQATPCSSPSSPVERIRVVFPAAMP
jgi:hypothetical protein